MIPYLIESEMQYRKDRVRKGVASSRSGRSRASWRRRVAAAEKSV